MAQKQIGYGLGTWNPNATDEGLSPLEDAILGLVQGIGNFIGARQLRKDTQAKLALQHQKLLNDMNKAEGEQQLKLRELGITATKNQNEYNLGLEQEAGKNQRNAAYTQSRLDQEGMQQEYEDARQQRNFDFQKNFLFPHQVQMRQTTGGTADVTQGAITDRANLERARRAVSMLVENGVLDPESETFQQDYADAMEFYSMTPEEQQLYLQKKAENDAQLNEEAFQSAIPKMRQDAIGALGQLPEARQRIDQLAGQNGGNVRFQDIYGAPAEQVIGPKDEPPTAMIWPADPKTGSMYREDEEGNYQPNLSPFRQALKLQIRRGQHPGAQFQDLENRLPYRGAPRK